MDSEPYHLVKTMEQHADGSWSQPVLHADPSPLIGKQLVVAIRYPSESTEVLVHFYGPIARISEQGGIVISRSDTGSEFAIPPRAYLIDEHQRATRPTSMTQTIRPDYSTLITLSSAPRDMATTAGSTGMVQAERPLTRACCAPDCIVLVSL